MADGPLVKVAGAAIAAILLLSSCHPKPAAVPQADSSYASQVGFSDLHLSAEENFLGQQVVYLDGTITNRGPKVVRQCQVRLMFHDVLGQVVLRNEQEALAPSSDPLKPGQARNFQIRFDQIPDSWNQAVPELQTTSLLTQQP